MAALALAAAGTAATLLVLNRVDAPSDARGTTGNQITASGAWRLQISDTSNKGCTVTVTNSDTGDPQVFENVWATKTFQMHTAGAFQWEASDPGCRVVKRSGSGNAVLPFVQRAGTGDTDVFAAPKAPGTIAVHVLTFNGYGQCKFEMRDAADGRPVASGTVAKGDGPVRLEPNERSQVYLADVVGCDIRVSADP